ncbi:hypothetical protein [Rhizobium ruizarguesonis]|nr:hypothetical protein [Rhizobium ruizarguesonis]TBE18868.1 hypothetical protein ELH05_31485 [Rhizobium ruizarguesonis]WSH25286.1 hypothetical protein U8Q07_35145 [Rhizobium ruizarguesonis]WSH37625.1 hypothetical protein U8P70_31515 [Rhizobium ruizarguesonis]
MADDWDGELRLIVRNLGDTINVDLQLNDRLVKSVNSFYNLADVNEPTLLFTIDLDRKVVGVFPLITYRTSNIYSQKYKKIHSIWFELPPDDWDAPTDHDSAIEFLKTYLPGGFVHDPTYGLGVTKEFRPIIHAIEEIEGVSRIVIGTKETTRHEHSIFYFRESDFFNLRTVFGRTTRRHQQESLMERNILAHNNVLHNVYPDKYRLTGQARFTSSSGGKMLRKRCFREKTGLPCSRPSWATPQLLQIAIRRNLCNCKRIWSW